jgi:hypothetical protein
MDLFRRGHLAAKFAEQIEFEPFREPNDLAQITSASQSFARDPARKLAIHSNLGGRN